MSSQVAMLKLVTGGFLETPGIRQFALSGVQRAELALDVVVHRKVVAPRLNRFA